MEGSVREAAPSSPLADPFAVGLPGQRGSPQGHEGGNLTQGETQQEKRSRVGSPLPSSSPLCHAHPLENPLGLPESRSQPQPTAAPMPRGSGACWGSGLGGHGPVWGR